MKKEKSKVEKKLKNMNKKFGMDLDFMHKSDAFKDKESGKSLINFNSMF